MNDCGIHQLHAKKEKDAHQSASKDIVNEMGRTDLVPSKDVDNKIKHIWSR
jgi:hypothetical protein